MKKIMSTILMTALLFSCFAVSAFAQTFKDVPEKHWAYNYIERAFSEGMINGSSYDAATNIRTFTPEGKVTFGEFIMMLTRYAYPEQMKLVTEGTPEFVVFDNETGSNFCNSSMLTKQAITRE